MENLLNTRRSFLKKGAITAVGFGIFNSIDLKAFASEKKINSPEFFYPHEEYVLPPLQYAYNALEPYIDAKTMEIHHSKHHQTYVTKLNEALAKAPELKSMSLDQMIMHINDLPESVRTAVRNHGGGHWNHSFFWKMMSPDAKENATSEKLKTEIISKWQSMDNFKAEFNKSATGLFGSGWAWLVKDSSMNLSIVTTPNQDNPLMDVSTQKGRPIMGVDVWEHAYYLKHQNKRPDYLNDIWNVIDWATVSTWYEQND